MSNRTKRVLLWLLATAVLSAAIHYTTIVCYPHLYMSSCLRLLKARGGMHQFVHGSPPTAQDREIPRLPSPDLTYSAAAFDLSQGPLRVTAPFTGQYTSVSLYASNTDNFFITNDSQMQGSKFVFVLVGPDSADPAIEGIPLIRAPSSTGAILVRFFAANPDDLREIDSVRGQLTCTLLK